MQLGLMNKIPKTIWMPVAVIAAIYAIWSIVYPSGTWRYRMTVSVETPEGIKTGSAVREIHAYSYPQLISTTSATVQVSKGEAVVVDLGKRGVLFALIGEDYGHRIIFDVFPGHHGTTSKGIRYYRSLKDAKVTLEPDKYPTFVRFLNINDPETVQQVSRADSLDRLRKINPKRSKESLASFEEAFGSGIRVKEVSIEITRDKITSGIQQYLPWLANTNGYLDGQYLGGGPELSNILHTGYFQKGEKQ